MRITFTNSFHNTEATVNCGFSPFTETHYITDRQYNNLIKKLCGNKDCKCGVVRGGWYSIEELREGGYKVVGRRG